jgi:uncharacterized sodium:solute symporter family permease YidK
VKGTITGNEAEGGEEAMNFKTAILLTTSVCLGIVGVVAALLGGLSVMAVTRQTISGRSVDDGLAFGTMIIHRPIAVLAGWAAWRCWPSR